jgi:integrase
MEASEVAKGARHQNHGLRKVCTCPRARWPRCRHSWRLNFKLPGPGQKHHRISLDQYAGKRLTKAEADALADELRAAIRAGTYPPPPVPTPALLPDAITFRALGDLWIERARKGEVASWDSDRGRVKLLAQTRFEDETTLGERIISRITADDLQFAMRTLRATHAKSTRNKCLQVLLHVQRWGLRHKYLTAPWFDGDTRPAKREKGQQRSRRLVPDVANEKGEITTPGEERRLLAVARPHLQRLIIAALESACRLGELLQLQWKDVDLARGRLVLKGTSNKTGKSRTIPISQRLRSILELIRTNPLTGKNQLPTAYVFGTATGEPIGTYKKAWETALLKAHGITPVWVKGGLSPECRAHLERIDLTFHDLRHEAGSRWLEAGWPLHHIMQMLGHANLEQTSIYLNVHVGGLDESMRRFDGGRDRPLHSVALHSPDRTSAQVQQPTECSSQGVVN